MQAVEDPLPEGWTAYKDAEGNTFYASVTGESTWTRPEASLPEGWTVHQDSEGRTFYANSVTGESSWTRPTAAGLPSASVSSGTTVIASTFIQQLADLPHTSEAIGDDCVQQLAVPETGRIDTMRRPHAFQCVNS